MESLSDIIMNNISRLEDTNEVNLGQIFNNFLQQQGVNRENFYKPPTDVIDDGRNIIIYIDIPGINPSNLKIDFFNNKIEVAGERVRPYTDFIRKEIIYGDFNRKITIPISVTNKDSVSVSANNGVLKININKTIEEKNKFSIKINDDNT